MLNPVAATESLTRTPYCTPRVSSALVNRLSRVYASAPKYHEPRVAVHCCNLCSWGHVARPKESDSATEGNVARPLHRKGDVNMYLRGQGPEIKPFYLSFGNHTPGRKASRSDPCVIRRCEGEGQKIIPADAKSRLAAKLAKVSS